MKSFIASLFLLVALAISSNAFQVLPSQSSSTSLSMFGGKKPAKKDDGPADFLKGRGARITVREEEDAAMWVDEPKQPAAKKGAKKGDAAPKKKKGLFGW